MFFVDKAGFDILGKNVKLFLYRREKPLRFKSKRLATAFSQFC